MYELHHTVPMQTVDFFAVQAQQKIASEQWVGRNVEVKIANFLNCWVTEEAFKQLLIRHGMWFRHRGMYFGDASGAGADFHVKVQGIEVSVGLRSVSTDSLLRWKSVAYPDDRFRDEQDKIAQYHVVCHHDQGHVRFLGAITKEKLLLGLADSVRLYSKKNQEYFRVVHLERWKEQALVTLLEKMDRQ